MKKRYDEIMEKIEVTEEMRSRILQNIQQADITPHAKIVRFPSARKYLSLAACLAILFVGVLTVPSRLNPEQGNESEPLAPGSDIVTVSSAKELSDSVGFEIKDIPTLPFSVENVTYTVYWQELAQISYSGEGQTLTFRKSADEGDNSGNYIVYENIVEKTIDGNTLLLKGDGDTYSLVLWESDGYSYSLYFENGVQESDCIDVYIQVDRT